MWEPALFSRASMVESVSFSGIVQMDEDTHYNTVEDVVGSHVEDAVTFWAQVNRSLIDFLSHPFVHNTGCPQQKQKLQTSEYIYRCHSQFLIFIDRYYCWTSGYSWKLTPEL